MKRIFAMLLALVMVLSLVPVIALAEPANAHTSAGHGDVCSSIENWQPWEKDNSLPASGNWYLTADVTVKAEVAVSGTLNLCLNGHTVTGYKGRAFNVTGTLHLCSCQDGGTFTGFGNNAHGGVIQSSGTVYAENITFTNNNAGTGYGGVLLSTGGTVTFKNCTFHKNTAAQGSAISVAGTTTLTGCSFTENTATASGALRAVGSKPILVENCSFTGNTAKAASAIQTGGTTLLTLKDVTITGNTNTTGYGAINAVSSIKPIVLQGKVIITGNTTNGKPQNLHVQNGTTDGYDVSGLTAGSSIGVSLEASRITANKLHFTTAANANNAGYFTSDDSAYTIEKNADNKLALKLIPVSDHKHDLCGNTDCPDHDFVEYLAWTKTDSLPASGNWYLTADVTVKAEVAVSGTLNLCLNGHTVTGYKGRAFHVTGTLHLCSCQSGATVTGFGNNANGGVIQSSGTVYAENVTFTNNNAGTGYGGVLLSTGGTVTFKNCTFHKNTAAQGSAISVAGTTTLTGCSFTENTATASGALRAVGSKPILVENCSFTGNTAKAASAIQTGGTTLLTLKDVTVTGNTNTTGYGAVNATSSVKPIVLQGKVIITGNTTNGNPQNLHVQNGTTDGYDVSGLIAGSSIGVSLEASRITANKLHFTTAANANNAGYFTSDNGAYTVEKNSDNKLALKLIPVSDHKHDLCGNTDCPDHAYAEYLAWDKTDSLPTEGSWYLTADVTVKAEAAISGALNLCLNGHTVNGYKGRAFHVTGTLHLCSCQSGATVTGFGNNANGGVIQSSGTVYAENITFTNNNAGTGYGGVLLSTGGTVTFQNCTFHKNTAAQGSAISVASTTTLIGCSFTENTATASGTLRAVGSKPILVENCSFTGNTAKAASAIQTGGTTLLTLKDVTITGNTNTTGYGAINAVSSIKPIVLQGKVVITGNTTNGKPQNLHVQNGTTDGYDVSGLTAGSSIGVSLEASRITANKLHFTTAATTNNAGYFVSDDDTYEVALGKDGKLLLQIPVPPITHIHCICGKTANPHCEHTDVNFADWTDPNSLPSEGTWCLTTDVTLSKTVGVSKELTICLNGHSVQVEGRGFYCASGAKLTITDCGKSGQFSGATNSFILFPASATDTQLNLWNGSFTDGYLVGGGAAVVIQGETVFNMYGGSFENNWVESKLKLDTNGDPILENGKYAAFKCNGGALFAGTGTTFNLYGGTFTGNKATHIEYTDPGAKSVTKSGGQGGALAIYGTANLYGGKIVNNEAFLGGGVFVSGTAGTVNLLGTEISGNKAYSAGGMLAMSKATVNMTSGKISGNTAGLSGGGMYLSTNAKLTMTGGSVENNSAVNNGGGFYLQQSQGIVKGGTVSGNKSSNLGGGFYLTVKGAELTVDDCLITKNEATSGAGIFAYENVVLTINGGKITANKSNSAGGGISAFAHTVLTVNGGSITNNTSKNDGGGLYLLRTNTTFKNATVSGNTGANGGGIKISGGKVTFSGTSITGNQAVGKTTVNSTTGQTVKTGGTGGGINISQAGYKENGIQKSDIPTVTASGIYVANNMATSAAGGILVQSKDSRFTMYGSTVTGNEATAGGGGIYFSTATNCKVQGGTVSNNTSLKAGGIFILNCQTELSDMKVTGNTAGSIGGGFVISSKNTVATMKNMQITDNISEATGGAMVIQGYATMTLENGEISRNSAKTTGGLYFSNPSYGTFKNVEFAENTSETAGGAIQTSSNCDVQLENCTLRDNRSNSSGGAVYNKGRTVLDNCKVLNNSSGKNGGGLGGNQAGSPLLGDNFGIFATNTVISGNQAAEQGGGIYNHRGNPVYLEGCTLTDNTSGMEGSAICSNGRLGLTDTIITGNNGKYALYVLTTEFDGRSYISGHRWLSGNVVIRDNQGGDMYLKEGAILAVLGENLGENTHVEITLEKGYLTKQLQGVYHYELADGIYTVTAGDRSITDPEIYQLEAASQPQKTAPAAQNDLILYIAIGVVALAVLAAAVLLILKKKKSPNATKE